MLCDAFYGVLKVWPVVLVLVFGHVQESSCKNWLQFLFYFFLLLLMHHQTTSIEHGFEAFNV